jgi:hypothetical protein
MMKNLVSVSAALVCVGLLGLAPAAQAQYQQDFDGLNASPTGVVLTGQDGYYLPNGTGDSDFMVYTYAGNSLGIVQNPEGGSQFIAGTGPGDGTTYARAQRNVTFNSGVYELWYDFCGIFSGAAPGSNNVGSFSMRQSTNTVHINLFTWVDPNNPVAINSTYVPYDAFGTQFPIPGTPPGPEWSNLSPNHWYRCRTVVDLNTNMITEVGIRDLAGGTEAVYNPTDWYLFGGSSGSGFLPDAIRWFGGGGGPGNTTAWDNALVEPFAQAEGACCLAGGTCVVTTEADCQGTYMGDNTPCDPSPCEPNPVEVTTWGAIKNQYH